MNRIEQWSELGAASEKTSYVEQSVIHRGSDQRTRYSLFAPLHYERNYAYPLVIWLHGPGDDERQLNRVMPLLSMRNYVAVAPRGTTAEADACGFVWDDLPGAVESAEQRVIDCIRLASDKFNIAPTRIFIGGFQGGGTMAFRIAMQHPEWFAGALSVGGPFPLGMNPLQRIDEARRLPLFIAHGRNSFLYPIERTCDELRLFHAAGMSVSLRQYPCGDELDTQMLHDMNVWMMELITGVNMAADDSEPPPSSGEYN